MVVGDLFFVVLCYVMSIFFILGILLIGGVYWVESGFVGEILIFLFMGFVIMWWVFVGGNML